MLSLGLFFFKQKTAYEMRISDWSSDVCSSDLGTLSPPAVLACLPFTPDLALDALGTMCRRHPEIVHEQGFTSGFNADLRDGDGRVWVSPGLFGPAQGIIVPMIENHRRGLPWRPLRGCRPVVDGLRPAHSDGGQQSAGTGKRGI